MKSKDRKKLCDMLKLISDKNLLISDENLLISEIILCSLCSASKRLNIK